MVDGTQYRPPSPGVPRRRGAPREARLRYPPHMTRLALAALLVLAACGSSAKYTVPAAAINSGLAVGAAAASRATGGCIATCTNGTFCNPRTGLCETGPQPTTVCQEAPGGGMRCVPIEVPAVAQEHAGKEAAMPAGISPATGSVPPPPSEASPR
jgi:hypothetical protein